MKTIRYALSEDEELQIEIETAIRNSMDQNLRNYCQHLMSVFALAGIDIQSLEIKKVISYEESE
ncbi:MAG: hypothetical protein AAFN93_07325 [Bacteroidota bacterium]